MPRSSGEVQGSINTCSASITQKQEELAKLEEKIATLKKFLKNGRANQIIADSYYEHHALKLFPELDSVSPETNTAKRMRNTVEPVVADEYKPHLDHFDEALAGGDDVLQCLEDEKQNLLTEISSLNGQLTGYQQELAESQAYEAAQAAAAAAAAQAAAAAAKPSTGGRGR